MKTFLIFLLMTTSILSTAQVVTWFEKLTGFKEISPEK